MVIINILITIVFYFVLMYLSVNLLGLLIRGLFINPEFEKLKSEGHEFIKQEIKKSERADNWINIIALIFIIAYFYLLLHFWNIGVLIVAIMFMVARLPDLLWEIKNGRKIDVKSMPKNALYYVDIILTWGALPILYYSLYYL